MTHATGDLACARVRVGDTLLAVDVRSVERAVAPPPGGLARMPRRAGAIAGVLSLDGEVVPVAALGEWVHLGPADGGTASDRRILILRGTDGRLGIEVDGLLGVQPVRRDRVQRIYRDPRPEELFDCVVPSATPGEAALPLLEADRLLRLANMWCDRPAAPRASAAVDAGVAAFARFAVFSVGVPGGEKLYAVPAEAACEVAKAPVPESTLKIGDRRCGVTSFRGRKIALVDGASLFGAGPRQTAPWMAVLTHRGQMLGVGVAAARQLIALRSADIEPSSDQPLLQGVAVVSGLGSVRVLDMARVFEAAPETVIGGTGPIRLDGGSPGDERSDRAGSPYIVFEADRRYASPVDGIVGIVALESDATRALAEGTSAMIRWRDRTARVVAFPSFDGRSSPTPTLAVMVSTGADITGIAIDRLEAWLPARAVTSSHVRLGTVGDVSMVTLPHSGDRSSVVIVNLQDMGHLLS